MCIFSMCTCISVWISVCMHAASVRLHTCSHVSQNVSGVCAVYAAARNHRQRETAWKKCGQTKEKQRWGEQRSRVEKEKDDRSSEASGRERDGMTSQQIGEVTSDTEAEQVEKTVTSQSCWSCWYCSKQLLKIQLYFYLKDVKLEKNNLKIIICWKYKQGE